MAKRRKLEEGIEIPEFDPKEYYHVEKEKTTLYLIFSSIAIVGGISSAAIQLHLNSYIAVLAGFITFLTSYLIPKYVFKIEKLRVRDKIGPYFTLIFIYLSIWILLLNPPTSDVSPPSIIGVYYYKDGRWNLCEYYEGVYFVNTTDSNIKIGFRIVDPSSVREIRVIVGESEKVCHRDGNLYYIEVEKNELEGTVVIEVVATDGVGNTTTIKYNISLRL